MASIAYKFDTDFPLPRKMTSSVASVLNPSPVLTGKEDEVLNALSAPSLTNVIMSGLVRDNGLVNFRNRGRFYAARNEQNKLEGVALMGHSILFEAFTEDAIQAFATLARSEESIHLLMGEHTAVQKFWNYYADEGQSPRLVCPVIFLRRTEPFRESQSIPGLRPATQNDLEHVMCAQAAMAFETSGVDPLKKDPVGFRERYLRRIEKNRVWVLMKNGRLVFKTDVIAETPEAAYIEGVYVSPEERGKGIGRDCVSALGQILLQHTRAIYLFVEQENTQTHSFYLNLGFSVGGQYDLLYF
ncbi:MAG TPA: GNAT family N-acetyltransferase [Pyrinomonadaceae bacterium]